MSAKFGGQIIRGYEVERRAIITGGSGALSNDLNRLILKGSRAGELVDQPTEVIMNRYVGDSHKHSAPQQDSVPDSQARVELAAAFALDGLPEGVNRGLDEKRTPGKPELLVKLTGDGDGAEEPP